MGTTHPSHFSIERCWLLHARLSQDKSKDDKARDPGSTLKRCTGPTKHPVRLHANRSPQMRMPVLVCFVVFFTAAGRSRKNRPACSAKKKWTTLVGPLVHGATVVNALGFRGSEVPDSTDTGFTREHPSQQPAGIGEWPTGPLPCLLLERGVAVWCGRNPATPCTADRTKPEQRLLFDHALHFVRSTAPPCPGKRNFEAIPGGRQPGVLSGARPNRMGWSKQSLRPHATPPSSSPPPVAQAFFSHRHGFCLFLSPNLTRLLALGSLFRSRSSFSLALALAVALLTVRGAREHLSPK